MLMTTGRLIFIFCKPGWFQIHKLQITDSNSCNHSKHNAKQSTQNRTGNGDKNAAKFAEQSQQYQKDSSNLHDLRQLDEERSI